MRLYTVHKIKLEHRPFSLYLAAIRIYVKLVDMLQNRMVKKPIPRLKCLCWTNIEICKIEISAKKFITRGKTLSQRLKFTYNLDIAFLATRTEQLNLRFFLCLSHYSYYYFMLMLRCAERYTLSVET